jgi:ribonuclease P protein component
VIPRTGRFERADRLLRSKEFGRIGRLGKRLVTAHFVVLVATSETARETEHRRLGITVSRRVGNAVVRNRIKRGVREWFRQNRRLLSDSVDLIVIARKAASSLSAEEVGRILNEMLFAERSASS